MTRSRVVVVAILAAASFGGWRLGQAHRTATAAWTVVDVVDGDTITVTRGDTTDTVRLLGVDTPETHHPRKPVECFGPEAAAYTDSHLRGRSVQLEGDIEERDRYGRRLAYIIVDGERFNDDLLRRGYARLLVIEPNHAHARTMLGEELAAKRTGRGLWSEC
ncbi:MAG TPA: thermonuclease family protein [Acidimicrobiia bacterium]|nr:thermonuclease family protein [Acidimicrobiia bacterium]